MEPIYIEPWESEQKYQRLAELGRKLKIPVSEAFLTLKVTDRDGIILHHTKQRSHSWTRNAYQMLMTCLSAVQNAGTYSDGSLAAKKTDGTVVSSVFLLCTGNQGSSFGGSTETAGKGYRGAVGDPSTGISIGRGDTAESFDGYALALPCAEGTGANQLNYLAGEAVIRAYDAPSKTLSATHKRYANNNSPGTITVKEIGLIAYAVKGTTFPALMCRDVLVSPVDVPASGQILVTYTVSLVYPA